MTLSTLSPSKCAQHLHAPQPPDVDPEPRPTPDTDPDIPVPERDPGVDQPHHPVGDPPAEAPPAAAHALRRRTHGAISAAR
jgi:hypothetical protein